MRQIMTVGTAGVADRYREPGALLIVLFFLGLSFVAVGDQLVLGREMPDPPDDQGRTFTLDVSALDGPDCLDGCLPNPLGQRALPRELIIRR
jgi:hypothetical protein